MNKRCNLPSICIQYSSEEEEETLDKAFSSFQNKQQTKKLDTEVDHSKINYEPFRKNFYVEVRLHVFSPSSDTSCFLHPVAPSRSRFFIGLQPLYSDKSCLNSQISLFINAKCSYCSFRKALKVRELSKHNFSRIEKYQMTLKWLFS